MVKLSRCMLSSETSTRHVVSRFGNESPVCSSSRAVVRSLKIGLMTDTFLPVSNGVTHMVAALARLLAELGHEPHIFTFAPTGELRVEPERLLEDAPHFLRVPPRDDSPHLPNVQIHLAPALPLLETGYYFGVRYPIWMRNLLEEMDVLHVHHPFISGRLALRLRREDQPIVFTNHTRYDIYSHYVNDLMSRRVQTFVEPIISPQKMLARRLTLRAARFANKCDAVIAPSHSVGRVLEEWGVTAPLITIPNGVDLSRFKNLPHSIERQTARAVWNISEHAPLALYVGRLAPEKNGRVLLESFALALRELALRGVHDAKLLVVGNGPSNMEWKEWVREFDIENAVVFAGAMDAAQVPAILRIADVFVSASVSEVHPLTFIEAMASGLPCIGTPSPGVCDMIKDSTNGENSLTIKSNEVKPNGWIARDEPREFAQALIRALSQPEERARRGAQAQRDSEEYAIEYTVSGVLELYQRVLSREHRVLDVALANGRNNS